MMRYRLIAILGAALTTLVTASTLTHDLGRGLVYIRVSQVPDDLPVRSQAPAMVLDLRYARGPGIGGWLTTYAARKTPIFVLANQATDKLLHQSILGIPGSISIGIPGSTFTPDIALDISADEEKRAYDALTLTEDLDTLLYPPTHKERFDEAAMFEAEETVSPAEPSLTETDGQVPTPLIDHAILRAVQIHRGWLVLRSR